MKLEQAIKNLKEIIELSRDEIDKKNEKLTAILDLTDLESLDIILSILEEKNKIIDLMTKMISIYDLDIPTLKKQQKEKYCEFIKSDEDCCWKTDKTCADCIKQYFENEAKEKIKC